MEGIAFFFAYGQWWHFQMGGPVGGMGMQAGVPLQVNMASGMMPQVYFHLAFLLSPFSSFIINIHRTTCFDGFF